MADNAPLGTGVHPQPPHTTVTSSVHRPFRPRSQITILDVDLASALSVAPAPHSWKVAEQRVMSEFGGSFPGPVSPDADPPAPQKVYFVGDSKPKRCPCAVANNPMAKGRHSLHFSAPALKTLSLARVDNVGGLIASNASLSSACSNSTLNHRPHSPSMPSPRSPSPEVFGTVPVHCVRVIEPGSRRNSGESFYAYFIEDGDVVYDPPEEIPTPTQTGPNRGRFREVVSGQGLNLASQGYHANGAGGGNSSSDQEDVPPPAIGRHPSGDKRRNRISQVIVDASKRSKRRMTSCTIQ